MLKLDVKLKVEEMIPALNAVCEFVIQNVTIKFWLRNYGGNVIDMCMTK